MREQGEFCVHLLSVFDGFDEGGVFFDGAVDDHGVFGGGLVDQKVGLLSSGLAKLYQVLCGPSVAGVHKFKAFRKCQGNLQTWQSMGVDQAFLTSLGATGGEFA